MAWLKFQMSTTPLFAVAAELIAAAVVGFTYSTGKTSVRNGKEDS
jgi:hypothetical protein